MALNKFSAIFKKRYRFQILACISVHILTLSHGAGVGWLSPVLRLLQSPQTPLDFIVTVDEASWIGSLFGIGMITGNVVFGFLVDRIGRKWSMYIVALPHIIFWLLIYFVQSVEYLYLARFCAGITSGGLYIIFPIYISEISDISIRGALSSLTMFFVSVGILVGYILASQLDYFLMPLVILALPLLYLMAIFIFPETPQHLLRKGKIDAAEIAFAFYKDNSSDSGLSIEQTGEKCSEFDELKTHILKGDQSIKLTLKDFVNTPTLCTFATAAVLIMLNQLSGSFAIVNYMSGVFAQSGSDFDPDMCTIVMGVVQIIGTCITTVLVDRYGRKVLLLSSAIGMAVSMIALGAFTQFMPRKQMSEFSWVPLALMTCIILASSWGVIALIFTLIVEILPAKIRSVGTTISMLFMSSMVFVSLKLYPYFLYELGLSITMYSCASVCILGAIYHSIFLPETKNKSMDHD